MDTHGLEVVLVAGLCIHCGPAPATEEGVADSGTATGALGTTSLEADAPMATDGSSTGSDGDPPDKPGDSGGADDGTSTGDDGAGTGAPRPPTGVVPCGRQACEIANEFCLACDHGDQLDAHCLARSSDVLYEELGREFEHGCTAGVSLFIECDENTDCGPQAVCRFVSGDFGFAFCDTARAGTDGQACEDDSDCDLAMSCGAHDPIGYFGQYAAVLGWTPQACQP